jgi:ribokinase
VARIVVVGSINQDLVVRVPRLPAPGETISGSGHFSAPGGKGANQAVAAARLGGDVVMVGRVGADDAGRRLVAGLEADGVDTRYVEVDPATPTGLALITVDAAGENTIALDPGANRAMTADDVDRAAAQIRTAAVVLLQMEIPVEVVAHAALMAAGTVVLNPAPATPVPEDVLARVDVLVPNAGELALLAGGAEPSDPAGAAGLAVGLGARAVVVTLGPEGAVVVGDGDPLHVAAPRVDAVDTTAAGDAFCGALAVELAAGRSLDDAVRVAVAAGAVAVTAPGAQPSLPTREQVAPFLTHQPRP